MQQTKQYAGNQDAHPGFTKHSPNTLKQKSSKESFLRCCLQRHYKQGHEGEHHKSSRIEIPFDRCAIEEHHTKKNSRNPPPNKETEKKPFPIEAFAGSEQAYNWAMMQALNAQDRKS